MSGLAMPTGPGHRAPHGAADASPPKASVPIALPTLTIRYHAGNPKKCRIPELTIAPMPASEGGGWYLPRVQAEALVHLSENLRTLTEALQKAVAQFEFMAKLVQNERIYEVEKATGKRVRKSVRQVVAAECELSAHKLRAILGEP